MPSFPQFQPVTPRIGIWHAYDPSVKADLFSTALVSDTGTFLVDPIPPDPASLEQLTDHPVQGIVVTNQNHWRASASISGQLSVPVFAHPDAAEAGVDPNFSPITDGTPFEASLQIIAIDGAAPGEIAIFAPLEQPVIIVGDALINFEPYGFALLPKKYCTDHGKMRQSLTRLLEFPFDQMFFAHGLPILDKARQRLEDLLGSE